MTTRRLFLAALVVGMLNGAAVAPSTDPWIGTWKLNVAKIQGCKERHTTIEASGKGMLGVEVASDDAGLDFDCDLVRAVHGMEVREAMLIEEHPDDNPEKARNLRHTYSTSEVMTRFLRHSRAVPTDISQFLARVVVGAGGNTRWRARLTSADAPAMSSLNGVSERPMIIRMPTASRPQQRYDHRLRDLVQRTGDLTIATKLGVPRSTARGWLGATPTVVVSLKVANLTEPELRQEILKLRRRVEKLAALLRLALALIQASGFRLSESVSRTGRQSCGSCAP